MGVLKAVGIRGIVVVGADRLGYAPIRHGESWIEFCGMLERACCFIVIECVNEAQSLIEELLRLGIVRRHGMMQIAEAGDESDGVGRTVCGMILRGRKDAQQSTAKHVGQNFHLRDLLVFLASPNRTEQCGQRQTCKCRQLMPNLSACQVAGANLCQQNKTKLKKEQRSSRTRRSCPKPCSKPSTPTTALTST